MTPNGLYTPPTGVEVTGSTGAPGIEVGDKFTVETNGYAQTLWFYKNAGDTGTHTGTIWQCATSACLSGTAIGTVTFSAETASGWQSQALPSAVALSTGTVYVISYHNTGGTYEGSLYPLSPASITNGVFTLLQNNGVNGPNAVYALGSGGIFPTTGAHGFLQWLDVTYSNQPTGGTMQTIWNHSAVPQAVGTQAILQATSTADANATAMIHIGLLPQQNSVGSIRIDSGNDGTQATYALTDGNGNDWLMDTGIEMGPLGCCGVGNISVGTDPENAVYATRFYASGDTDDIIYRFIVPNGNYKLKELDAFAISGNIGTTIAPYDGNNSNQMLGAQGQVVWHNLHIKRDFQPSGYSGLTNTPASQYVPALVTNNTLQFTSASILSSGDVLVAGNSNCLANCRSSGINGLEVTPDSSQAHWAIDTQDSQGLAPGASLWQIYSAGSSPWEVGNFFVTNTSGYIVGGRIYKPSSDTSTHHTIELWQLTGGSVWRNSQSGKQLATCSTGTETTSGYQSCNFSTPVPVSTGIGMEYVILADVAGGGIYYAPGLVSPDQQFSNGTVTEYFGTALQASGGQWPNGNGLTVSATYLYAVDPIFSASSIGSNPQTLFPWNNLPGQQLMLYQQDWYTGLNDPQWSILSGPGTISNCIDLWGMTGACYTAPWTPPSAGSGVVVQAESKSNPAIKTTATLRFSGTMWGVR